MKCHSFLSVIISKKQWERESGEEKASDFINVDCYFNCRTYLVLLISNGQLIVPFCSFRTMNARRRSTDTYIREAEKRHRFHSYTHSLSLPFSTFFFSSFSAALPLLTQRVRLVFVRSSSSYRDMSSIKFQLLQLSVFFAAHFSWTPARRWKWSWTSERRKWSFHVESMVISPFEIWFTRPPRNIVNW